MDTLTKSADAGHQQIIAQAKEKRNRQNFRNAAWSDKAVQKAQKEKRKSKKEKKQEWLRSQQKSSSSSNSFDERLKRKEHDSENEWEELAREERMAKKLKQGKVDAEVFDQEFAKDL